MLNKLVHSIAENTFLRRMYYVAIVILAVISVVFSILDFTKGLTASEIYIDYTIYGVFVADYLVRFFASSQKALFVKENVLDLISILPFNSIFRVFRVAKLAKLLRIVKLLKTASVFGRLLKRSSRFLNTNGFKYMLIVGVSIIVISSFCMMSFEGMTFEDSIWWSFVTMTTVGYGDLSPASAAGRVVAVILMVFGIGLVSSLTSTITSFFFNKDSGHDVAVPERVDMVMTLYEKLNDHEKDLFKQKIQ